MGRKINMSSHKPCKSSSCRGCSGDCDESYMLHAVFPLSLKIAIYTICFGFLIYISQTVLHFHKYTTFLSMIYLPALEEIQEVEAAERYLEKQTNKCTCLTLVFLS